MLDYIKELLNNMPDDWLRLTTHRLDIYNESLAKTEFLEQLEDLYASKNAKTEALANLPTAYDYIRLGHPLSSVLEWAIAKLNDVAPANVVSFSSTTTPILAILRKNLLENRPTRIVYNNELPTAFGANVINEIYGYQFEIEKVDNLNEIDTYEGSTIIVTQENSIEKLNLNHNIEFYVSSYEGLGSIIIATKDEYISEIQHVRRRETIAMTPANCLTVLKAIVANSTLSPVLSDSTNKENVLASIKSITNTKINAAVGSSGLSIQYAIVMGLIHDAINNYPGQDIKVIVPPNCYGGTNDQARRIAACIPFVEIMDLPVDGNHDMVSSIDTVLTEIAEENAVPYIIAEIPTNPRVEVPDLIKLRDALSKVRMTSNGDTAIAPVFILDQTFCPNVHFLGDNDILSSVKTISYVSGSKFPSGGLCTAGYCTSNTKAENLMDKIHLHLTICDNEATPLQYKILAKQMPSMLDRIKDAYTNTRDFVNFIGEHLPEAKMNFVSEALAEQGFTPSVFSLDLPTSGASEEEKENYKRKLNDRLINLMINQIPNESKYCVSYGQLKGCYWTIPATSTQGTTKEGDKDYIVRAALSANMDLEHHKEVFLKFVKSLKEDPVLA